MKQVEMAGRATCTRRASSRGSRLVHSLMRLAFVYTRETRADADTAEVLTMDEAGAWPEPGHSRLAGLPDEILICPDGQGERVKSASPVTDMSSTLLGPRCPRTWPCPSRLCARRRATARLG